MKKELATFALLVVLCAIVTVLNPRFVSAANLQNTARLIGAFGIVSLGLGLVRWIRGGRDIPSAADTPPPNRPKVELNRVERKR